MSNSAETGQTYAVDLDGAIPNRPERGFLVNYRECHKIAVPEHDWSKLQIVYFVRGV